jgi:hypothetical protein
VGSYFRNNQSYFLNRALRELIRSGKVQLAEFRAGARFAPTDLQPFLVDLPLSDLPPWRQLEEIEAAVQEGATEALARLARRPVTPGEMLARKNVPAELRSQAARSMLAMRGGKALAAKMREAGYRNLVKAREAKQRRRIER